jgi:competence protein ComEA
MQPSPPAWRALEAPAPAARAAEPVGPRPLHVIATAIAAALTALLAVIVAVGPGGAGVIVEADGSGAPSHGVGATVVVEVVGAVARPGIVRVPAGARVGDAISAAGGFGPQVDAVAVAARLDLAAPVTDGGRIVVPARGDPSAGSTTGTADQLDLNTASAAELEALPGIGEVTAAKIIDARADAPFASVDDLRTRGLVGEKTFERIRDLVTVGR